MAAPGFVGGLWWGVGTPVQDSIDRSVGVGDGEHEAGNPDYDYTEESDREASSILESIVEEKGFFILPSELFSNVRERAPRDEKLNETLERVFHNIEGSTVGTAAEGALKGLFDGLDVNSSKRSPSSG